MERPWKLHRIDTGLTRERDHRFPARVPSRSRTAPLLHRSTISNSGAHKHDSRPMVVKIGSGGRQYLCLADGGWYSLRSRCRHLPCRTRHPRRGRLGMVGRFGSPSYYRLLSVQLVWHMGLAGNDRTANFRTHHHCLRSHADRLPALRNLQTAFPVGPRVVPLRQAVSDRVPWQRPIDAPTGAAAGVVLEDCPGGVFGSSRLWWA